MRCTPTPPYYSRQERGVSTIELSLVVVVVGAVMLAGVGIGMMMFRSSCGQGSLAQIVTEIAKDRSIAEPLADASNLENRERARAKIDQLVRERARLSACINTALTVKGAYSDSPEKLYHFFALMPGQTVVFRDGARMSSQSTPLNIPTGSVAPAAILTMAYRSTTFTNNLLANPSYSTPLTMSYTVSAASPLTEGVIWETPPPTIPPTQQLPTWPPTNTPTITPTGETQTITPTPTNTNTPTNTPTATPSAIPTCETNPCSASGENSEWCFGRMLQPGESCVLITPTPGPTSTPTATPTITPTPTPTLTPPLCDQITCSEYWTEKLDTIHFVLTNPSDRCVNLTGQACELCRDGTTLCQTNDGSGYVCCAAPAVCVAGLCSSNGIGG
jgi:hypothetical protein